MVCELCEGLSISLLVDLTKTELVDPSSFPQEAYYRHHPSYASLVGSAQNNCKLCGLILSGFMDMKIYPDQFWEYSGMTRSQAAVQVEAEGLASDIKVCISADHLYAQSPLAQEVELFDVLLIQIGAPQQIATLDDEDPYSQKESVPPLKLALSVPPGGVHRKLGKVPVGRLQVDPVLGSQLNFEIARSWLKDCCTLHDTCFKGYRSKLPTRVVDVGVLDDFHDLRLILSKEIEADYIALSHCWGGKISPLLTTANLEAFQEVLPFFDLPANFKDAISITRQLGIRYLWIDSLCIMQDSKVDWEIESKKMGFIYRDALLTLSATTSRRSTDGILRSSALGSMEHSDPVCLNLGSESGTNEIVQVSLKDDAEENLRDIFSNSALFRRGWTLQEDILSYRVLYYGERQIYWGCPRGYKSADGLTLGRLMPDLDDWYPEISKILHSDPSNLSTAKPDVKIIFNEYYSLVKQYNIRELSFNSDKLPAFSGVAAVIHPAIGGEYLAGIWTEDWRRGLTWYRDVGECRHTPSNKAPSWSWAVTNDPVLFDKPSHQAPECYADLAQLLSHSLELTSENVYGPVDSGTLIIRGHTKRLFRSRQAFNSTTETAGRIEFDECGTDNSAGSVYHASNERESFFFTTIDSRDEVRKELDLQDVERDLISEDRYLVVIINSNRTPYDNEDVACLVLIEKANVEIEIYHRAGVLMSGYLEQSELEEWLEGWELKTVTIV